jgi:hypothetical protein
MVPKRSEEDARLAAQITTSARRGELPEIGRDFHLNSRGLQLRGEPE